MQKNTKNHSYIVSENTTLSNSQLNKKINDLEKQLYEKTESEKYYQQQQQLLKESEEKYRALVDNASIAIALISQDKWIYANKELTKTLGYTTEEFLQLNIPEIMPETPLGRDLILKNYNLRMSGLPSPNQYEAQLKKKDGKIIDVIISASRILINGRYGLIATAKDITDAKRAKEQELIHQEELLQTSKMAALGTLVSGIAHEINNPNNYIMLNTPILLEVWKDVSPIIEKYYTMNGDFRIAGIPYSEMKNEINGLFSGIIDGSKRIQLIVQHLKDFARKETADMDQKVNMNKVIDSAVILLENQLKKCTNHFSKKLEKKLPNVRGNFQRLEQVIINLIQNACQSLRHIEQQIGIETCYNYDEGNVIIKISDQGEGIPQEYISRIMDPFFTTKREQGGTGLGLSISLGIIRDHNGRMEFISKMGKGTEVLVTLPSVKETV